MRAQYPDAFGDEAGFNERFNTTYYKQNTPVSAPVTVSEFSDIGDATSKFISYEYATFLYSCEGGEFTFQITRADDIALAWFGDVACGDFEQANNQTSGSYHTGAGEGKVFSVEIPPEKYFPIRLIYVNAAGPASLDLKITGPDGTIEGNNFYPVPCDNSNQFIPFGKELSEGKSCNTD